MILDLLLSLIPWRLVAAGVFALVFAETLTLLLFRAISSHNRKQFR